MAQRLPIPGQDEGTWGDILNQFLDVSHNTDGTLADNTVGTNHLKNGAVTNAQLDAPTQSAITSIDTKYSLPSGGVPKTDLVASVQSSLANADSAVRTVNGKTPSSGAVALTAADLGAISAATADAAYSSDLAVQTYSPAAGNVDNTATLAAAISDAHTTYADTKGIDMQGAHLSVTGLTLNLYSKLRNGSLTRFSGTAPQITVPLQSSLQSVDKLLLHNLLLDGSSSASGGVGVYMDNHAAAVLQNVRVKNEGTGLQIRGAQFCDFYSVKAYNCKVGIDLANKVSGGGGNSLLFDSLQAVNNEVGILIQNVIPGTYPMHSIELVSPQLLSNSLAAIAAFNVNNINVRGFANEVNGGGAAASGVYNGYTVKRSSVYLNASSMNVDGGFVAEATVNPVFKLENGSKLNIRNLTGYGNPGGVLVDADSTSQVSLVGEYGCIGATHGVVSAKINLTSASGIIAGSPTVRRSDTVPNTITAPQSPGFADTSGASASLGIDPIQGAFDAVQYAASAGTADTNRLRMTFTFGSATLVAATMQASVDTVITIRQYPNVGAINVQLRAGEWTRVYWWNNATTAGAGGSLVMFPADASGASLKVCKWQVVTGSDSRAQRSQWNAVIDSAYNAQADAGFGPAHAAGRWSAAAIAPTRNTQTAAAGTTIAVPGNITRLTTIDALGIEITTGAAGGSLRLGIWLDENGAPGRLVLDGGTVSATGAGLMQLATSATLSPGRYWYSVTPQGASNIYWRAGDGGSAASNGGALSTNITQYVASAVQAAASMTGALPASFGSLAASSLGDAPVVTLHAV